MEKACCPLIKQCKVIAMIDLQYAYKIKKIHLGKSNFWAGYDKTAVLGIFNFPAYAKTQAKIIHRNHIQKQVCASKSIQQSSAME